MSFSTGSQIFRGGTEFGQVLRVDGFVSAMFTWREWLEIGIAVHFGRTWFTYGANVNQLQLSAPKPTDPVTNVNAELSSKFYTSIEPTIRLRVYEFKFRRIRSRLSFWVYGTFESQLNLGDELNINTAKLDITTNGTTSMIDLTSLIHKDPNLIKMHYQFNRYEAGAFVRLNWRQGGQDRLSASMLVGWQRLDSRVTILLNQSARDTVMLAGLDPSSVEGGVSLQNDAPIFLPELAVRVAGDFWIRVSGAAAPVNGQVFFAGRLALEFRINP